MIVLLVRHGQTQANEHRLYAGQTDIGLSRTGLDLLERQSAAFPLVPVDICIHSSLKRTLETAEILFPGIPKVACPAIMEMDFGDFEMKSHDELLAVPAYSHWLDALLDEKQSSTRCPGGESLQQFRVRVDQGWRQILSDCQAQGYSRVAIITHGGVITHWMNLLFPGEREPHTWQPACGGGFQLELDEHLVPVHYVLLPC